MPELPEVEIIKRGLSEKIIGKGIADVDVRVVKMFQGKKEDIVGAKISKIKRRAKMLLIGLSNDKTMLIHLKMTGQLVYRQVKSEKLKVKSGGQNTEFRGGHPQKGYLGKLPNKFTHVIFTFKDGGVLYFNDLRKFGYIKVYDADEIEDLKVLKELGPEPFTEELTVEYLMRICAKRPRVKIKQILMDQTVISGIGNIYADESLFCAGISPLRLSKDVKRSEFKKIIECVKKVLKKGLKYGGSSENTFVNVGGEQGQMQNHFQVYRQTGKPCPKCGGKIVRIVITGRGTHYCPKCQQ